MSSAAELQARAKRRWRGIQRRRRDPRFRRVMGRFVHEGLLSSNVAYPAHTEPLEVDDVLWAGEVEPRCLELLPALLVKRPSMFTHEAPLPADLAAVVRRLRRNLEPSNFRGIRGGDIIRWLPRVGRPGSVPARLKSFRFKPEDLRLLEALAAEFGVSETEVVRRGLRALARDAEA